MALPPYTGMSGMLTQRGEIVAFVGATRFYLVPYVGDRDIHDRDRRAVIALCRALVHDPACYLLDDDFEPPSRPPS